MHSKVYYQNVYRIQNVYKSKKLGSYFNIKDSTRLEHQHDFTYLTQCPAVNCNETYLGEQSEDYEKESMTMLKKTKNPTWLNIVWTKVIHRYV